VGEPAPRTGRLRTAVGRVRQVPRGRLTAGAAVVALAVSVPFGGLKQSYAETHPAVRTAPDRLMHADPFSLTVTGASVLDSLRSYRSNGTSSELRKPGRAGDHLLVLRVTVVNTSDASVGSSLLDLAPFAADGVPTAGVVYVRPRGGEVVDAYAQKGLLSIDDATDVSTLSPGVEYHLALVTGISGAFPATVEVGVARMSHDPVAFSPDVLEWQHPEPAYQLTVPVVDKRGAKQRPEGWTPAPGDEG
jgi:hypothetical protein